MKAVARAVFSVLVWVCFINEKAASAAQLITVGGSQGWDPSTDFNSWSSKQTFNVGDKLLFKYAAGLHGVVEVPSESDYKNCDTSNAVKTMNGGNDVVTLDKAVNRYFICPTPGHCSQGMKLKVATVASTSSSSTNTSSPSSSPPSSPAAPTTSGATSGAIAVRALGSSVLVLAAVALPAIMLRALS